MTTNVIMPALGMDQDTGTLLRWIKHEGDAVTKGEPIMEIETDKVTVEIEANATGVLTAITAGEGDEIPVGTVIAQIVEATRLQPGEAPQSIIAAMSVAPLLHAEDETEHRADSAVPVSSPYPGARKGAFERLMPASPLARRLASEQDLDLAGIRGGGPEGAVLAADVQAAMAGPERASAAIQASADDRIAVSRAWQVMAERMTASWTTVPHFVLMREVDASGLAEMRRRIGLSVEQRAGMRPTYSDLLVKLVAAALRRHPRANASWIDGTPRENREVHIGLAVATDAALVVPVIRDADTLSVGEIAQRRHELVERANAGKLTPSDVSGGTFTITNLGMWGVDAFNAIVNPPQAAILAVGRIADRVVAVDGQPAVRPTMILTLSADHRAIDGARAAQFLAELAGLVEEPWGLLA
ncbi:MAG: hypothetical protein QOF51_1051 [Chloroflexota bacterium]|nr:hypothetical protein [Chloroflexota bacterium]